MKVFDGRKESLTDHCIELMSRNSTKIRKQSLDEKFNMNAVEFVKKVAEDQLRSRLKPTAIINVQGFNKVFVHDSTRFGLPDSFKDLYPSYGGRSCLAGLQIQFGYELVSNQIHQIELYPATRHDRSSAINNEWIEKGSLVLRDLGYFSMEGLAQIHNKEAYFVSRAFPRTSLFTQKGNKFERVNLESIVRKMTLQKMDVWETELFIGLEHHMPVRTVITLVPDEIKAQRLRRANSRSRKGRTSKEYKAWAGVNVFLTNTTKEQLSAIQVTNVYRSRWQVEIVFKTWKSFYSLNMFKNVKIERVLCYLYASLIQIMLHWQIYNCVQEIVWKKNKQLISLIKFSKIMCHYKERFTNVCHRKKEALLNLLELLILHSKDFLYREKKKGKFGFEDQILNSNHYLYIEDERVRLASH